MATEEFDREELNREKDIHNEAQERLIARTQDLLKVLLVLSGGALAVCASFFSAGVNLYQLHQLITPIQVAWLALTASILAFGITMVLLVAQDSQFSENRRRYLGGSDSEQRDDWPYWVRTSWIIGLIGLICFCIGMGAFCWAALGYLQAQR